MNEGLFMAQMQMLRDAIKRMAFGASYAHFYSLEPSKALARSQNLVEFQNMLAQRPDGWERFEVEDGNRLLLFDLLQNYGVAYSDCVTEMSVARGHVDDATAWALNKRFELPDRAGRIFVVSGKDEPLAGEEA